MAPVSGEVPRFDLSGTPDPTGPTIVTVAGAVSGAATGAFSSESLPEFYRRALGTLTLSGVLATSGAVSGMQCLSGSVVSGIRNLHQELALRAADAELGGGQGNALRLSLANSLLTASGEVQFGS